MATKFTIVRCIIHVMNIEIISALCAFAFVSSVTPGPNNLMLMTSGANFGLRRTMPHFLGVVLGFMLMILLVGAGLVQVFEAYPVSHDILRFFSVGYIVYLAGKISRSKPGNEAGRSAPLSALQAALFQWVNPKAGTMAVTSVTVYAPDQTLTGVLMVALVFGAINLPAVSSWTLIGLNIARFLGSPERLRAFNVTMAVLLVLSLYPVIWP